MSEKDEDDRYDHESNRAQTAIKKGNFKALYNKKYGDVAFLSQNRQLTPEQIFDLAIKYFSWAEENAIKAAETASFQGVVTESLVHKVRVFTVNGLCLFCGFTPNALTRWRKEPGYAEVFQFIDSVIFEQKFQLAANGIVNASFIGKELGIDKGTEINVEANASASAAAPTTEEFKDAVRDILGEL